MVRNKMRKLLVLLLVPNFTDSIRLPDNSSIFTAEAKAIDIALYHIRDQSEKQFIIYSDSLSRAGPGLRIGQTYPLRDVRAV